MLLIQLFFCFWNLSVNVIFHRWSNIPDRFKLFFNQKRLKTVMERSQNGCNGECKVILETPEPARSSSLVTHSGKRSRSRSKLVRSKIKKRLNIFTPSTPVTFSIVRLSKHLRPFMKVPMYAFQTFHHLVLTLRKTIFMDFLLKIWKFVCLKQRQQQQQIITCEMLSFNFRCCFYWFY